MRILFYQDPPNILSTQLTWTLGQELVLRGHDVHFAMPKIEKVKRGSIDWVRGGGENSWDAVKLARAIGAKVHIHLEGVGYWRIGADFADNWGVDPLNDQDIEAWKSYYRSWMSAAYEADSCSVNGQNQIDTIQRVLFDGRGMKNCHRISCGVDARYGLTLPEVYKRGNYIVTVSRIAPNKRIMKLAEAMAMVHPEIRPPWVVVGYGKPKNIKTFGRYCEEHGIAIHAASAYGAQKWMWIKRARLMLQGWNGIPPAEGLICKTPVLSYGHEDIVELFGQSISFAEDNNAKDMSVKIENLLSKNYNERVLWGKKFLLDGKLYACTQEQAAAKYEQIFMNS